MTYGYNAETALRRLLDRNADMDTGTPLIIPLDVRDAYGNVIANAGEEVTQDLLATVACSGRFTGSCRIGLSGSMLMRDMEAVLQSGPYSIIFSGDRLARALQTYDSLRVLPVFFEEFEGMRQRDRYLYEHTLRTAALTALLAFDIFGEDKAPLIGYTALTHDIGMVRLPDEILKQDIGEDAAKRFILYGHTVIGHVLLTYYTGSPDFSNSRVALDHHERPNGSGYPRGITLQDRVIDLIAVADTFDALISPRPFRKKPIERRQVLDYLLDRAKRGYFSETVVRLLILYNRYGGSASPRDIVSEEARLGLPDDHYLDWSTWKSRRPAMCLLPSRRGMR